MPQTAVITGASDGIGYAIAERFAKAAADVVIVARDPRKLTAAAETLRGLGGRVTVVVADLAIPGAAESVVTQIVDRTDRIHALINNVGVAHFAPLAETTDEQIEAMVTLNIKVPLAITRGLLPKLTVANGSVVNISSY